MLENEPIKRLLSAIAFTNDQAAYKELFLLLHGRLKQFAYSILKSQEEAEELVSDLFIKVWEIRPEEWLVQLNSIYFDPEQLMMTEEMMRQIRQAVNNLPPRCRLIFKLVKEDGLKYKEVAELLQLSIKTIEAQMAIALRRIGKYMHMEVNQLSPDANNVKKS